MILTRVPFAWKSKTQVTARLRGYPRGRYRCFSWFNIAFVNSYTTGKHNKQFNFSAGTPAACREGNCWLWLLIPARLRRGSFYEKLTRIPIPVDGDEWFVFFELKKSLFSSPLKGTSISGLIRLHNAQGEKYKITLTPAT